MLFDLRLSDEIKKHMFEQFLLRIRMSLKYGLLGGALLLLFEPNHLWVQKVLWGFVFLLGKVVLYYSCNQFLGRSNHFSIQTLYLVMLIEAICWLSFLFVFGLNESSAFQVFWRGSIVVIVLVFMLDALSHALPILIMFVSFVCVGILLYIFGFTQIDLDSAIRMGTALAFSCVALLMFGYSSYQLNYSVSKAVIENRNMVIELDKKLSMDSLTNQFNRRFFDNQLRFYLDMYQQANQHFCVAIIDVDHFKPINDVHGHQAGDAVLVRLGEIVNATLRRSDIAARYGGDEFVAILPHTFKDTAEIVLDRMRQKIAESSKEIQDFSLNVTVSVGMTTVMPNDDATSIMARADKALYEAKSKGRNLVIVA